MAQKESLGLGLGEGNGATLGGTAKGRGPEPCSKAEVLMRGERQTSRGQAEEARVADYSWRQGGKAGSVGSQYSHACHC